MRAIAEVSTAVTQGDLTRSITVEASGEVAELKDNINQMIANLRETTQQNAEQDWLKTNLARISGLMQGQRDLQTVSQLIMSRAHAAGHRPARRVLPGRRTRRATTTASCACSPRYGYKQRKSVSNRFRFGEGLVGQAALETKRDPDHRRARRTTSRSPPGLGEATPRNIIVLPVLFEEQVLAVIELASFSPFSEVHLSSSTS